MNRHHIFMLASENDALRGGKIGGLGDVLRDLPVAFGDLGWRVTVITPGYGFLRRRNHATVQKRITFPFGGRMMTGTLWKAVPKAAHRNVTHLLFEHKHIRGTPIYCNDPPRYAFAQDATKYALFCSAIGQYLKSVRAPFLIHLHDWHMATLLLLRELHPAFRHLAGTRAVFTIHNLAIQGTRPFRGPYATVEKWFPELFRETGWIPRWKDPRYEPPAYTPMATGVRLAERVNTVSPTYAEEILKKSNHALGFYGGEGLERFLRQAKKERRLFGILNGITYPSGMSVPHMAFRDLLALIEREVIAARKSARDRSRKALLEETLRRVKRLGDRSPEFLLTAVTRVTEQKIRLFFERGRRGTTAMEEIMLNLALQNGVFILIGSGTREYEALLEQAFRKHERFLYIKLYSDAIASALYSSGTIFMMPSSFEPCGIGQMIAMRNGQPCVVHATGGLKDSVEDGVNGFRFSGNTPRRQVEGFVKATGRAIDTFLRNKPEWARIRQAASESRFTWEASARRYVKLLYS